MTLKARTKHILLAAAVLCTAAAFTSMASPINYVRIEEEYQPLVADFDLDAVEFHSYQGDYTLSYALEDTNDTYHEGDTLKVRFKLLAGPGKDFKDIKINSCRLNDRYAFKEMNISEDLTELSLYGEFPALGIILEAPMDLQLDPKTKRATWTAVEKADSYEVRLKIINEMGALDYVGSFTVAEPFADLRPYLYKRAGDYIYSVVAHSKHSYLLDSAEEELPRSDSLIITEEDIGFTSSVWSGDGKVYINGEPLRKKKIKIEGYYYYFDENARLKGGWIRFSDGWEYYSPSTYQRVDGLKTIDGRTYYFDPETGKMTTGFAYVDELGKEVFFGTNGVMKTGWVYYDGKVYYIKDSGERNYEQLYSKRTKRAYFFDPVDGHLIFNK